MPITARLASLACLAIALQAQSLPPLGEPLLNASGQNSRFSGVASVRYGPICFGIFVSPTSAVDAPAYVLANGHCINLLGTNEVVLDRPGQGEATFFVFVDIPAAQRVRIPIKRVAYATQKGIDLSILELDSTAAALIARGIQPSRLAASAPRSRDAIEVVGIPVTGVSEADRVIRLSACTAGQTVQLLEGRWHTYSTAQNDCIGIRGGSSGSPVFDGNGEVAGLVFTTTWGESPLAACANNRPCEVTSNGTISPDETSYSVPLTNLAACFNDSGRFDIGRPACPLDPGGQLTISGYPLAAVNPNLAGSNPIRPTPTSWNTRVDSNHRFYSYKIGPVHSTDCRDAQAYSTPQYVEPDSLINDTFPLSDSREQLCVVAGDSPAIDSSWQPFRFSTQARVVIDTLPPVANPSAHITPGEIYIVLFEYLAEDISFYDYKAGSPGATNCSDPDGYRTFVQRLFLNRAGEPYQICAIPIDAAGNRGKPWGFILNQIGFLNAASRAPTTLSLLPDATTAMTGDFPQLPVATLSTVAGISSLATARRDHGEIWLSMGSVSPANTAILRLADPAGALSFPVRVIPGAPGIFTSDGSGSGAPAGSFKRPDGSLQSLSAPIPLDPARDTVIDVYATSILQPSLSATLGGRAIDIASAAGEIITLRVPAGFPLRGELDLVLRDGDLISNTARIIIQ